MPKKTTNKPADILSFFQKTVGVNSPFSIFFIYNDKTIIGATLDWRDKASTYQRLSAAQSKATIPQGRAPNLWAQTYAGMPDNDPPNVFTFEHVIAQTACRGQSLLPKDVIGFLNYATSLEIPIKTIYQQMCMQITTIIKLLGDVYPDNSIISAKLTQFILDDIKQSLLNYDERGDRNACESLHYHPPLNFIGHIPDIINALYSKTSSSIYVRDICARIFSLFTDKHEHLFSMEEKLRISTSLKSIDPNLQNTIPSIPTWITNQKATNQSLFLKPEHDLNAITISLNRDAFLAKMLEGTAHLRCHFDLHISLSRFKNCLIETIKGLPKDLNSKHLSVLINHQKDNPTNISQITFLTTLSKENGNIFLEEFVSKSCDLFISNMSQNASFVNDMPPKMTALLKALLLKKEILYTHDEQQYSHKSKI